MEHIMHLEDKPFNLIKNGRKTIELRLLDEKRKLFKKHDIIEIINRKTSENIHVEIEDLYLFENFEELYKHIDKDLILYDIEEMESFYPKEEQNKYGVVGIKIKRIQIK